MDASKQSHQAEESKQSSSHVFNLPHRGMDISSGKDKELRKKAEKDYITECIRKDEEARQQDLQNKLLRRQQNIEVRSYLENQVSEKKRIQKKDMEL